MLKIFKSYSAKTSLLDDFNFYENKERSFHGKKSSKPATLQMDIFNDDDFTVRNFYFFYILKYRKSFKAIFLKLINFLHAYLSFIAKSVVFASYFCHIL